MSQSPSFFHLSSYWDLNKIFREIVATETWLTNHVYLFFQSAADGESSDASALRGIAALACSQKYRQDEIPLLFDKPVSAIQSEDALAAHVPFTMENLSRLISVYEIWQTLSKNFKQGAGKEAVLPYSENSFLAMERIAKEWKNFCIAIRSRETFLDEFKADAISGLFLFVQEILRTGNHPLAGIAKKIDVVALASFPSFGENHIGIHQQMRSILSVYVLCGICESEPDLLKKPDYLAWSYWASMAAVLKQYPYLDELKTTELSSNADMALHPLTNENRKIVTESIQLQEAVRSIVSTL